MPRTNKKACRGSGRLRGAVGGERLQDSSAWMRSRLAELEPWTRHLRGHEVGILLALIRQQPADGSAVTLKHAEIAALIRMKKWASVAGVKRLRALGLLEVAVQGNAVASNQYRVPNPLPPAPAAAQLPPAEGGAA